MATWADYWRMAPTGERRYVQTEDFQGWQQDEAPEWNPASGFATPEAYLAATYGLPAWAAPFVGRGTETDIYNRGGAVDAAGFFRPGTDASGNVVLGPVDPSTGNWAQRDAFLQAAQQALGGGVVMPLADAQRAYTNSEIPSSLGISFQDYLNRQYVNPRTQNVGGVGDFLVADSANSFDWGLGDRSSFLETVLGQMLPAALTMYGIGTGLGNLASAAGIGGGASSGVGALGDAVTGIDSLADFNNLIPGDYGTLSGLDAAAGTAAGGAAAGMPPPTVPPPGATPPAVPGGLGTVAGAATGAAGALGDAATGVDSLADANNLTPTNWAAASASDPLGAVRALLSSSGLGGLSSLLGGSGGAGGLDLSRLLASGLGAIGANAQADAQQSMFNQFMNLGAPYRASLASLEANPAAYYESPEVKGALQQGSDALARSLSAKVGNPILNPTALQEMQNYTTTGLLGQLNQRRNFLAGAGGLGVSQAMPLGANAAQASTGIYDALGSGVRSVFGNQRDYASELLDILRNQNSLGSGGGLTVKLS